MRQWNALNMFTWIYEQSRYYVTPAIGKSLLYAYKLSEIALLQVSVLLHKGRAEY